MSAPQLYRAMYVKIDLLYNFGILLIISTTQFQLIVGPLDDVLEMIYLIEREKIVTDYLLHT